MTRSNVKFSENDQYATLRLKRRKTDTNHTGYSSHSFRRGAAQHASDNGMLDEDTQKLGRWSSESFRLYFTTSAQTLYNLNMSFQTGRPVALQRA